MTMRTLIFLFFIMLFSCKINSLKTEEFTNNKNNQSIDLTIALGSCNKQSLPNILFKEIVKNNATHFIWLGDAVYSDTNNPKVLAKNLNDLKNNIEYQKITSKMKVIATWDDHDYGLNDGGEEHIIKKEAQQIFLNFTNVPDNDIRRKREGIYYVETIRIGANVVRIINLDTRYFRSKLTNDPTGKKRYIQNKNSEGTMLGNEQWKWLENELLMTKSDFTIFLSGVQLLSNQHGFEAWGNMPHEVKKFQNLLIHTKTKNAIFLSGDRHIAEISKTNIGKYFNPLIDFTSSGLTHVHSAFNGEENPFRVSDIIHEINFGLLKFDFKNNKVFFEIRGKENKLLEQFIQQY